MNFRSVSQLSDQLVRWSKRLPADIDVVVGIPRSGLLAANLLSLYRNLPLADLDGFIEGRCLSAGSTGRNPLQGSDATPDTYLSRPRRALVVDDSIASGGSMKEARSRIEAAGLPHRVDYAAVYVAPEKTDLVDFYCEVLGGPRVFEWNVFNHHVLAHACVDMDGVLCHDPTSEENDDGPRYLEFIRGARSLLRPTYPIRAIVTNRLEKYREPTEDWLHRNGIEFEELIMLDYPDGQTRRQMKAYSAYKAGVYRDMDARIFIESDIKQSVEISSLSQKDVLCIDTMQMITPGSLPVARPGWPLVDKGKKPNVLSRAAKKVLPVSTVDRLSQAKRRIAQYGKNGAS